MPSYTGTNLISQIDTTIPSGTGQPSELDDSIREIKTIAKTVLANAHNDKGAVRFASWKWMPSTAGIATVSNNAWNRMPLATLGDPTGLLGTGTYTNTIKPIAGLYLVRFFCSGSNCARFQARISTATGNTLAPSAANSIADLIGGISLSNVNTVLAHSIGQGTVTFNGTDSIGLDMINETTGKSAIDLGTMSNALVGAAAGIDFHYLGAGV